MMRVSTEVIAVLDRATCTGNALSLADLGQLDRKLYAATDKVLKAAGGKWDRRAAAHLFEGDAADAIEPILLTGTVTSVKQDLGQFYTPPDLAARVIALADLEPGQRVLEPSAGRGALAAPAFLDECRVDCVELDPRNVEILCSVAYGQVAHCDFLTVAPERVYDRVVMNPPFAGQADIRHVLHAARFLRPGGRLVAIMSAGVVFRRGRLFDEFRTFLDLRRASVTDLPADAFKASGTSVSTVLVAFDMPGGEA